MVFKAFKYRLYPSKAQQRLLEQTLETCRRWYNTCLEQRKLAWELEQRSVGADILSIQKAKEISFSQK